MSSDLVMLSAILAAFPWPRSPAIRRAPRSRQADAKLCQSGPVKSTASPEPGGAIALENRPAGLKGFQGLRGAGQPHGPHLAIAEALAGQGAQKRPMSDHGQPVFGP